MAKSNLYKKEPYKFLLLEGHLLQADTVLD